MLSQICEPFCDSDKPTDPWVMCIRMLYGEVVFASTSLLLSVQDFFAESPNTQLNAGEKT